MAKKVQLKSLQKKEPAQQCLTLLSSILQTIVFLVAILSFTPSRAQDKTPEAGPPATTPTATPPAAKEETFEEKFLRKNIEISQWLNGVAQGLDLFLAGGRKLTDRPNETSVKIENSSSIRDKESPRNATGINVNLRLPNTEEYWQLKFTNYDDTRDRRRVQRDYLREVPQEREYGATLGLFRRLGKIRTYFQPRLALTNPLKISHLLGAESIANMGTYEVNPKLEFFGNPDQGTGAYVACNFNVQLTKVFTLTFINESQYQEKIHFYDVTNGASLGQFVTDRSALSYGLFYNSNNRPNYHLEGYTVSVSWNELIYRKIFDYQITPNINFARVNSFQGRAGVTLSLNLNF